MNFWIAAVCFAALGISLLLTARREKGGAHRAGAMLLQIAIWGLVWALVNPPALLPSADTTALQIALPQSRDALRDLPPMRLRVETESDAAGWQVNWPQRLSLGEPLQLRIAHGSGIAGRLFLEDPFGGEVDSTVLSAEGGAAVLNDTPKLAGRWLYQLRIETEADGGTIVRREPLPVQVHAPEAPRILLWLARPGFETAALSRWLRQSGAPARVVTQLAPEIIRRESFNGLDAKTPQLLDPNGPFDLLILDSHLWPQLSPAQRRLLPALAERKSLLWLVSAEAPRGFRDYAHAQGMPLAPADNSEIENPLASSGEMPLLALAGYQPQQTRPGDIELGAQPIYWARNNPGQSLGFVLFDRSYRWITAGFAADYARLWKTLFDHQLAHRGSRPPIKLRTRLPREQQRVTLCSTAFSEATPKLAAVDNQGTGNPPTGVVLPSDGGGACHSWWPKQAGWHRIDGGNGEFDFYVFPRNAWPQWQRAIAHTDTRQMASARLGPAADIEVPRNPLPRYWIALALILLLGFSWLKERRSLR
ncbi:hypothetical protein [Microbulbifer rhizosphaerae]|uniref:Uncharacterized protein n=1 Tax=Microbulbifer rhizosphaerae TaxID=1562603 RepID=A0A7W4Z904_9GAMM|nr:hypothetical protein [Microbulbifer rhizosphaerae]MBB3061122.1 hypothetical protein [Microbulbifer rhizosphaerae]